MIARDTVQQGENIVTLAGRLTGNPLQWQEIVRLNKLRAPYLSDEPRAGTLSPGDAVLYPAPTAPPTPPDVNLLAAQTYKRDFRAEDGDLVLSGGHLTTEVGLANLRTALQRRLKTPLGRHPFHPGYGSLLYTHVGRVADPAHLRLVCVDARRALLRDPRVQDVTVTASWEGELLTVAYTVTPIPPGTPFSDSYRVI
ncbi:GPW/gp25 family protein (plasmid) [Deinococcus geothermalis DSM 11300]|uniref:GPW/gp25 family protein n=1 Tax=Deinococcus geothermalis (strain DSM 11300 / CIP 105573 / AG-3a) TaxID=319795 RepID=A8ZRG2_DEIGD|nr:DUF2634 domain-containing protein [Deinococcus geothermalis]ABW35071.1 GPW/gp25 family protein [Deinococcus geothermalis DSM 11300]